MKRTVPKVIRNVKRPRGMSKAYYQAFQAAFAVKNDGLRVALVHLLRVTARIDTLTKIIDKGNVHLDPARIAAAFQFILWSLKSVDRK